MHTCKQVQKYTLKSHLLKRRFPNTQTEPKTCKENNIFRRAHTIKNQTHTHNRRTKHSDFYKHTHTHSQTRNYIPSIKIY